MNIKKIIISAIIIVAVLLGAFFYYKNLRGIWPAVLPPRDIERTETEEAGNNLGLKLPSGFSISIFAKDLPGARVMAYDPGGKIIISLTSEGKVVALPDTIVLLEGLNRPHGLAVRCTEKCQLYVAETDKVIVYDYQYDEKNKIHRPINGRKIMDLPSGGNHFTRTILFLPEPDDHRLLISVGSSCNACEERDLRRAKILVSNADGSGLKTFASGLRNAVFMAAHPVTKKIWATEMGRDLLGDDLPPDEINIIEENKFYGWPWYYGKNIRDNSFRPNVAISLAQELAESHIDIPAHSAPLGLAFVPANSVWPREYWYNLFVAYHGSWNRSVPTGYKVVRIKLDDKGNYLETEDFITGWLTSSGALGLGRAPSALGRPVDILIQPGGTMYISDDKAGVIYKVVYKK